MLVLDDLIHIYGVLGIFLIIDLFIFTSLYLAIKIDYSMKDTNNKEKERIKKVVKEIKENEEK